MVNLDRKNIKVSFPLKNILAQAIYYLSDKKDSAQQRPQQGSMTPDGVAVVATSKSAG